MLLNRTKDILVGKTSVNYIIPFNIIIVSYSFNDYRLC